MACRWRLPAKIHEWSGLGTALALPGAQLLKAVARRPRREVEQLRAGF
jgi:hypothetical protein